MHVPAATYRVQLNKDFTFQDLLGILDYLEALGISTVYAAPILSAVPESMHGYDVTDPDMINPEIGTLEELRAVASALQAKGMSWLQDIVPNHMAFSPLNSRLMDVLERGGHSEYYHYFDINWQHPSKALHEKVMVPFLGSELDDCIANGELKLSFSSQGFTIDYGDACYPLSIPAYDYLAEQDGHGVLRNYFAGFVEKAISLKFRGWRDFKNEFLKNVLPGDGYRKPIDDLLAVINNDREKFLQLLDRLFYTLVYWKQTEKELNYRRFFTVNALICLRMEDEDVFQDYHRYLHALWKEKLIQGFRIDHIDGLYDPCGYIRRLQDLTEGSSYIIAEKILEAKEPLPECWPLQGTSGYEFLAHVSQLLTDRKGARRIVNFYRELVPDLPAYKQLVLNNKQLMLEHHMAGEWENLVTYFFELQLQGGYSWEKIRQALGLFMVSMPVYRIYPEEIPLEGRELDLLNKAFDKANSLAMDCQPELTYLQSLFTGVPVAMEEGKRILHFLRRLMQFTGPLTAKGVEDTTFYVYNPLISHDEVGDEPSTLGISIQEFHRKMILRQTTTPLSLNATATHDTKRGEDARLRLNVLSEMAGEWEENVRQWFSMNKRFHTVVKGKPAPTINDEYFIYQSLIGGFPEDRVVTPEFTARIQSYWVKVAREAKVNSNWENPDEEYENACQQFLQNILDHRREFLEAFLPFIRKVARFAGLYTLGQTLLKITAPGIPDTYQGTELWDLSFVDPDNRRPVSFDTRMKHVDVLLQKEKEGWESLSSFLSTHRDEGVAKLWVTMKALNFRRSHNDLFINGQYLPLTVSGKDTAAIAYARMVDKDWALVIVPLNIVSNARALEENTWNDMAVKLPEGAPEVWKNIFTGEVISFKGEIPLEGVFGKFPVALLTPAYPPAP
jgi:(1->4)-alpha-D-glucan 1-alpha-D-glucosylmutase